MSRAPADWRRQLRESADRLRDSALEPLAARLGYARDPSRRNRWRRPGSVLSIDGSQFFDHAAGRGGGGAIDLVLHARQCGFREALAFLADSASLPPTRPASPRPRPRLRLPPAVDANWPPVRDFLTAVRRLDPALLEACRRHGTLYADPRRNAVFTCRDTAGSLTGAELVGTCPRPDGSTFKGLAAGSRRDRGGFWLSNGSLPPSAVLLCESAVDALSACLLPAPGLPPATLFASTAGITRKLPAWLAHFPPSRLLCGFDADPPGDHAARALRLRYPHMRRLRPPSAKDWNDLLRAPLNSPAPAA